MAAGIINLVGSMFQSIPSQMKNIGGLKLIVLQRFQNRQEITKLIETKHLKDGISTFK